MNTFYHRQNLRERNKVKSDNTIALFCIHLFNFCFKSICCSCHTCIANNYPHLYTPKLCMLSLQLSPVLFKRFFALSPNNGVLNRLFKLTMLGASYIYSLFIWTLCFITLYSIRNMVINLKNSKNLSHNFQVELTQKNMIKSCKQVLNHVKYSPKPTPDYNPLL